VVIMDSALKGEPVKDFVSTVSTNNYRGGEMAGEQLLRRQGKVVLFRFKQGSRGSKGGLEDAARCRLPDSKLPSRRVSASVSKCSSCVALAWLRCVRYDDEA
jgi:hypothetical protein